MNQVIDRRSVGETTDARDFEAVDTYPVTDDDQPFSYLTSVTGECPVCGAQLKWAEIKKLRDSDGNRVTERWLVCTENHLTPG